MNKKKGQTKKSKREFKRRLKNKTKKHKKHNKYKKYFNILTNRNNEIKNTRGKPQPKKDKISNYNKVAIILIYADWCGHCQALRPIWNDFILTLNKDKYNIIEINSEDQEDNINKIKKEYNVDNIPVEGYPTIGHINQNLFYSYNGGRTIDDLKAWVNNMGQ